MTEDNQRRKVLWSCVARNETILAEAGDECYGGLVSDTAKGLLARKFTPGFEFHSQRRWPQLKSRYHGIEEPNLKGCKFHIYEHDADNVESVIIWVFAAVYDSTAVDLLQVQSFLEKIVTLTEPFRDEAEEWRGGGTLACQSMFAPMLKQRMDEVTYLGKMAMVQQQLETSKQIMGENIDRMFARDEVLQSKLQEKGTVLEEMAHVFKKRTKTVRRMKMMQDAKHGLIMGTAVAAGVTVAVAPLVALL